MRAGSPEQPAVVPCSGCKFNAASQRCIRRTCKACCTEVSKKAEADGGEVEVCAQHSAKARKAEERREIQRQAKAARKQRRDEEQAKGKRNRKQQATQARASKEGQDKSADLSVAEGVSIGTAGGDA